MKMHRKIERGQVLVLRWPPFGPRRNNQPIVGGSYKRDDGEVVWLVWSVWGGVFFSFWGGELNDKKNYKIKYNEGLRWLNGGTQQQTNSRRQRWGGAFERRRDQGGTCVGGLSLRSGRRIERQKIENKRGGDQALGGRQSIKKRHNQPYDSVGGGGLFEMRRYCGVLYGGDNITLFGRRINRQKLMKEKIRRGLRRLPNDEKNTTTN